MPPRHPFIAEAMGRMRATLASAGLPSISGRRVLVAWSGGPDSAALLGMLHLLAPSEDLTLIVGHVDHGLREASDAEADLVRRECARLHLPVRVARLELARGVGLPARARDARRAALVGMAAQESADLVALGHTATDQAETVLMHLARGAGLRGLSGMDIARQDPSGPTFIRPLLDLDRAQTRQLAELLELAFVDDPSNEDTAQPRIRIRREVLPVLRARNPGADRAIAASARVVDDARRAIDDLVEEELGRRRGPDGWFDLSRLALRPRAIRTGVIRAVCLATVGDVDALPRGVVADVDRALTRVGAPRTWDLRAFRVELHGARLRVVSGNGPREPNH